MWALNWVFYGSLWFSLAHSSMPEVVRKINDSFPMGGANLQQTATLPLQALHLQCAPVLRLSQLLCQIWAEFSLPFAAFTRHCENRTVAVKQCAGETHGCARCIRQTAAASKYESWTVRRRMRRCISFSKLKVCSRWNCFLSLCFQQCMEHYRYLPQNSKKKNKQKIFQFEQNWISQQNKTWEISMWFP